MKTLHYLMDHTLYQIFTVIFNIIINNYEAFTNNGEIQTSVKELENICQLEIIELILVHSNTCQQDSNVLHTFISNKSFGEFLEISPPNFIFLNTFGSRVLYIRVWCKSRNLLIDIYLSNITV